jgi:hypothetical protein
VELSKSQAMCALDKRRLEHYSELDNGTVISDLLIMGLSVWALAAALGSSTPSNSSVFSPVAASNSLGFFLQAFVF